MSYYYDVVMMFPNFWRKNNKAS